MCEGEVGKILKGFAFIGEIMVHGVGTSGFGLKIF